MYALAIVSSLLLLLMSVPIFLVFGIGSSAAAIHNHVHDIKEHKQQAIQASVAKGVTLKRIMRKKFSWKNYPGK